MNCTCKNQERIIYFLIFYIFNFFSPVCFITGSFKREYAVYLISTFSSHARETSRGKWQEQKVKLFAKPQKKLEEVKEHLLYSWTENLWFSLRSYPDKELPPACPETALDVSFFPQAHWGWVPRDYRKISPDLWKNLSFT